MSETVKSFTLKGGSYNVARASAVAQDELLSILTQALIQRLSAGEPGKPVDEDVIFFMFLAMPHQAKLKIDELMLDRVFKKGTQTQVALADVDVMDWNRLRAKVLIWNLQGFFTFWADASARDAASQVQAPSTGT
ncbi:hypothetical protein [Bordetella bronchiseptica]|uniref:hypothetical protein n=1 Tax=Bordetella bronchiseptica TaxID=518 RepID=UPI00049F817F|nr:hypothetical protein [Bordetella bronchiseptica]KDB58505.1 hypothetical protein AZ15_1936 [Bordetella bronchiseptica A1-7]KDB73073.1 hypothetical protein AZ21_2254 [Bordetella bronchiseptica B20-10725633]